MSYIKYNLDVNGAVYSEYDKARKKYLGDKLSRVDVCSALECLPMKSPKLWILLIKYELILKYGKARNTYYRFPKELPSYSRFQGMEKEFYNGSIPKKKKEEPKIQERETGRTALTEEFCIEFLKKRNYVVFKVEPDFDALSKVLTPEFLLQNSRATLK